MKNVALIAVALLAIGGCSTGEVSDADNQKLVKEFSQENYEEAMKKAGKGAELEAEKKRDEAYRNTGGGQ